MVLTRDRNGIVALPHLGADCRGDRLRFAGCPDHEGHRLHTVACMGHVDRRRGFAVEGRGTNITNHAGDGDGIVGDLADPDAPADNARGIETPGHRPCASVSVTRITGRGLLRLEQSARHEWNTHGGEISLGHDAILRDGSIDSLLSVAFPVDRCDVAFGLGGQRQDIDGSRRGDARQCPQGVEQVPIEGDGLTAHVSLSR